MVSGILCSRVPSVRVIRVLVVVGALSGLFGVTSSCYSRGLVSPKRLMSATAGWVRRGAWACGSRHMINGGVIDFFSRSCIIQNVCGSRVFRDGAQEGGSNLWVGGLRVIILPRARSVIENRRPFLRTWCRDGLPERFKTAGGRLDFVG